MRVQFKVLGIVTGETNVVFGSVRATFILANLLPAVGLLAELQPPVTRIGVEVSGGWCRHGGLGLCRVISISGRRVVVKT